MIRISVVIPTYNRSELLNKTLTSLTLQTLPMTDFEVIVIDDGGSDNARSICDSYNNTLNIRYFWQSNVAPLWGEHGSTAASTAFKIQPHINAGAT